MDPHVHTYKLMPVSLRKHHSLGVIVVLFLVFFPVGILYLLIPRGQETQFQSRCEECEECGAAEPDAVPTPAPNGNPCYTGRRR
jgi:hypothetical protein